MSSHPVGATTTRRSARSFKSYAGVRRGTTIGVALLIALLGVLVPGPVGAQQGGVTISIQGPAVVQLGDESGFLIRAQNDTGGPLMNLRLAAWETVPGGCPGRAWADVTFITSINGGPVPPGSNSFTCPGTVPEDVPDNSFENPNVAPGAGLGPGEGATAWTQHFGRPQTPVGFWRHTFKLFDAADALLATAVHDFCVEGPTFKCDEEPHPPPTHVTGSGQVAGTEGNDAFVIRLDSTGGTVEINIACGGGHDTVTVEIPEGTWGGSIRVDGMDGNDTVLVENPAGYQGGLQVDGGMGNDKVEVEEWMGSDLEIDMGEGDDATMIDASSTSEPNPPPVIEVDMGDGNNMTTIQAQGSFEPGENPPPIVDVNSGAGNDMTTINSQGYFSRGENQLPFVGLDTGAGNDVTTIEVQGSFPLVEVENRAPVVDVDMGPGDDIIEGEVLELGSGAFTLDSGPNPPPVIEVDMGDGNDMTNIQAQGSFEPGENPPPTVDVNSGAGNDMTTINSQGYFSRGENQLPFVGLDTGDGNDITTIEVQGSVPVVEVENRAPVVDVDTGPGDDIIEMDMLELKSAPKDLPGQNVLTGRSAFAESGGLVVVVRAGHGNDDITLDPTESPGRRLRRAAAESLLRVDVFGGAGIDHIVGSPSSEVEDVLSGGGGGDTIDARGGDDVARGQGGDDVMRGGAGNDRLIGGKGRDKALGGPGFDRCSAEIARCER